MLSNISLNHRKFTPSAGNFAVLERPGFQEKVSVELPGNRNMALFFMFGTEEIEKVVATQRHVALVFTYGSRIELPRLTPSEHKRVTLTLAEGVQCTLPEFLEIMELEGKVLASLNIGGEKQTQKHPDVDHHGLAAADKEALFARDESNTPQTLDSKPLPGIEGVSLTTIVQSSPAESVAASVLNDNLTGTQSGTQNRDENRELSRYKRGTASKIRHLKAKKVDLADPLYRRLDGLLARRTFFHMPARVLANDFEPVETLRIKCRSDFAELSKKVGELLKRNLPMDLRLEAISSLESGESGESGKKISHTGIFFAHTAVSIDGKRAQFPETAVFFSVYG